MAIVVVLLLGAWLSSSNEEERLPAPPTPPPSSEVTRPSAPSVTPARREVSFSGVAPTSPSDAGDCGEGVDGAQLWASLDAARFQRWLTSPDGGQDLDDLLNALPPERTKAWLACKHLEEAVPEALAMHLLRLRLEANAREAEQAVERYCAAAAEFNARPDFGEHRRLRDAAVFMAGRADWDQGHHPVTVGSLHLSNVLSARMVDGSKGRWQTLQPSDYAGLDFDWLRQLAEYDHWSIYGSGPLKDRDDSVINFTESQLPRYETLRQWVKLRLIKGVHEGDLAQASVEVRHLGELMASNATLAGHMFRSNVYVLERTAWGLAKQPPPASLPTEEDVNRFWPLAFSAPQFLWPGVPWEVQERALGCAPVPCTALTEAIGQAASLRNMLPEAAAQLERLKQHAHCEPAVVTRLANTAPYTHQQLRHLVEVKSIEWRLRQMPPGPAGAR